MLREMKNKQCIIKNLNIMNNSTSFNEDVGHGCGRGDGGNAHRCGERFSQWGKGEQSLMNANTL